MLNFEVYQAPDLSWFYAMSEDGQVFITGGNFATYAECMDFLRRYA